MNALLGQVVVVEGTVFAGMIAACSLLPPWAQHLSSLESSCPLLPGFQPLSAAKAKGP